MSQVEKINLWDNHISDVGAQALGVTARPRPPPSATYFPFSALTLLRGTLLWRAGGFASGVNTAAAPRWVPVPTQSKRPLESHGRPHTW